VIKKNLRAFSGYVKGQEKELAEKATERLERYHGDVLKHVCALLDISESGSKAKMIEHITTFLQNPKSSGHAYKGGSVGTKRKSASITKKGGKADDSVRSTRTHRMHTVDFSALHISRVRNDFVLSGRLASAIVHSFHRECCRQFFLMSHSFSPSSTCSARVFGWFCHWPDSCFFSSCVCFFSVVCVCVLRPRRSAAQLLTSSSRPKCATRCARRIRI
jgi:hypothetical protein